MISMPQSVYLLPCFQCDELSLACSNEPCDHRLAIGLYVYVYLRMQQCHRLFMIMTKYFCLKIFYICILCCMLAPCLTDTSFIVKVTHALTAAAKPQIYFVRYTLNHFSFSEKGTQCNTNISESNGVSVFHPVF